MTLCRGGLLSTQCPVRPGQLWPGCLLQLPVESRGHKVPASLLREWASALPYIVTVTENLEGGREGGCVPCWFSSRMSAGLLRN